MKLYATLAFDSRTTALRAGQVWRERHGGRMVAIAGLDTGPVRGTWTRAAARNWLPPSTSYAPALTTPASRVRERVHEAPSLVETAPTRTERVAAGAGVRGQKPRRRQGCSAGLPGAGAARGAV